jgi:hypothetical protein
MSGDHCHEMKTVTFLLDNFFKLNATFQSEILS